MVFVRERSFVQDQPSSIVTALTPEECSRWLAIRGLQGDPYHSANVSGCAYAQIQLPKGDPGWLFYIVLEHAGAFDEALLQITDWGLYQPYQMAVLNELRAASGERRMLIESPGHVFASHERELLLGVLSLVTSYGWTAYLYLANGFTLLSWEGEIMDVWCKDQATLDEISLHLPVVERSS